MNVLIGITLAPYRVDFYNRLHDRCDCEIHFVQRGFEGQLFSNEQVEAGSTYTPDYLRTLRLGRKRCIALGLRKILSRPGIRNVIVPEFSLLTLQVILLKLLFRYRFGIISHCDDSLDMLEGGTNYSRSEDIPWRPWRGRWPRGPARARRGRYHRRPVLPCSQPAPVWTSLSGSLSWETAR